MNNNIRTMVLIGEDDWNRPVYGCKENNLLWKDTDLGRYEKPNLYSCDDFEGEPDFAIREDYQIITQTKEIDLINVMGEKITIKSIDYKIALEVMTLDEDSAVIIEQVMDLLRKLIKDGIEDITNNPKVLELREQSESLKKKADKLRKEYNYYYVGLDNLTSADKKRIQEKYLRRV